MQSIGAIFSINAFNALNIRQIRSCVRKASLTDYGRMKHMCDIVLVHFTSVNGLSPFRCQAVTWSTPGSLSDEPLPINFCDTCISIDYVIKKTNLKILPAKLEPLCFGFNVSTNMDFTRQHMCIQWLQFSTLLSFYLYMSLSVRNE